MLAEIKSLHETDWQACRIPCEKSRGLPMSTLRIMGLEEFREGMRLKELAELEP